MEFTDKALVAGTGRFREADLWVRLLTPSRGLLTVFAFGGAKSRRRFPGCLDSFNILLASVSSDRAGRYLHLTEAGLSRSFPRLRSDLDRLGMAANCLKFVEAVQDGEESAEYLFHTMADTLRVLDEADQVSPSLPMYFRAGALFALGFGPQLECCPECGLKVEGMEHAYFAVDRGRLLCEKCGSRSGGGLRLSRGAVATLRFLADSTPGQWSRLDMPAGVREECFSLVDGFIQYHLGLAWRKGRFRRA
ncbi:DNA repair protein RecO [Desulfohalovibrio reitneri]|uniref:DNA repair protein RecO n=1 Tax=Desulfohalovibrio reitneri TaxID=1307759 RepID=UPI0004A75F08|nr:DNA repair protein RecO [Desulfohalovibrio reitneri]